jgi:uracil-DNA glycosylase family 4
MAVAGLGGRKVLFVGDAPDPDDDKAGEPMGGRSFNGLRRILKGVGLTLGEDCWATNALACATPRGRKPTAQEVAYCRPSITKVLRELKPDLIIPMSASAVNAVLAPVWGENCGEMARWAGWQIPSQDLNAWVCPTWHPRHLEREDDPVLERQFKSHILKALALSGAPWPDGAPDWASKVRHVTDPVVAARWLRKCAKMRRGAIAWDYETNMLKPDSADARIISCAVAWGGDSEPERCIAFPWHGEAIKAMGELLRSPIPKIASNLKFEDRWTRKEFGHRVRGWCWDTMLAAHISDNRAGITSVKFQAFIRLGAPVWNDKTLPFIKSGAGKVNRVEEEIKMSDLLRYNGLDAWLEFMVARDQIREFNYPLPWQTK